MHWELPVTSDCSGVQVVESAEDSSMQCRIDIVHRCERRGWGFRVDGRGECTENLAAVGAHDRGTDENASVDILHEKNESIVAGSMDPPPRRRGDSCIAGANRETALPSLGLRQADSA